MSHQCTVDCLDEKGKITCGASSAEWKSSLDAALRGVKYSPPAKRGASTDWQSSAQAYLQRLADAENKRGRVAHKKAGKKGSTYRGEISDYRKALMDALGRNDEEEFKATKMTHGYHEALGF